MRPFRSIFVAVISVAVISACGGKGKPAAQGEARSFPPLPSVPSVISDPVEANEYLASHFWDAFLKDGGRCDTALVNGVPSGEVADALRAYFSLLENGCRLDFAKKAVKDFFARAEDFEASNRSSNVFRFFEDKVSEILYDPNSPFRDEDLYLPFVTGLAGSAFVPEDMKPYYSYAAGMCSLNQTGTPAADISFTDTGGRRHSLYGIEAGHTLLFFSNPGCQACKEIVDNIKASGIISGLVAEGALAVVNIYIDGELDKWRDSVVGYPAEWYNGYDQDGTVRRDVTYNVRAIPSLYVLDAEKKVLMKDAPAEKAIGYLNTLHP